MDSHKAGTSCLNLSDGRKTKLTQQNLLVRKKGFFFFFYNCWSIS